MKRSSVALVLALAIGLPGCELLQSTLGGEVIQSTGIPPVVGLNGQEARLTSYPSLTSIAKYYCNDLLGPVPCLAFGAPPSRESLEFKFAVVFHIANPNRVPLPATEILVGLHLWPSLGFGEIGGVCTTFCVPGEAGCPIPAGQECVDLATDVQDLETFLAAALRGVLGLAYDLASGVDPASRLAASTIPGSGTLDLTFTFRIGIDAMLAMIKAASQDLLVQVLQSGGGELVIPYAVAGKLWFEVPYLGRVAIGVGPFGAPPDAPLTWRVL